MDTAQVCGVHAGRDRVRVGISACCAQADFRDQPASPLIAIMQRRKLIIAALVVAASSPRRRCSAAVPCSAAAARQPVAAPLADATPAPAFTDSEKTKQHTDTLSFRGRQRLR
ncbi:hypothetical protein HDG37_005687 [Paraburkholderia sp. MM5384-R2]|nr:hypothetical protein [Paraburkholderia sp. MM5384-R2]